MGLGKYFSILKGRFDSGDARVRQAVFDVVTGRREIEALSSVGLAARVVGQEVTVINPLGSPIPVTAKQVAQGWVSHAGDGSELRRWALFVHGASSLIDLAFDETPDQARLLEALWDAAFDAPIEADVYTLAERLANA